MTPYAIRVLILEDNPHDAALMVDALRRAGIHPEWERVDNVADFTARVASGVDLILSDYDVPGINGLQALEVVRSRGLEIPFILISGSIGEDVAVEAMRKGADDYLLKDRMARLGHAVRQAIEKRRLYEEASRAEAAQRESERRFGDLLANVDLLSLMLDREARITYVNDCLLHLTGWRREEVVGGNWFEMFAPDETGELRDISSALLADRPGARHHESEIRIRSGGRRLIRWNNTVLRSNAGEVIGTASIGEDITERKHQERRIEKLSRIRSLSSEINSAIIRSTGRQELFDAACRIAVVHGRFGIAWIGTYDAGKQEITPATSAGLESSDFLMREKVVIREDTPQRRGTIATTIRERRPKFNNDIASDAEVGGKRRQEALRRGYRSSIVLPLTVDGAVFGIVSLFAKEPGFFDEEEVGLLTEVAGNISFAVEHMVRQEKIDKLSRIRAVSGEINAAIVRVREREELLRETCRVASEHGKFGLIWIGTIDAHKQEVRPVAWTGFSSETAHRVSWKSISSAQGTLGEAIRTRKPAVRNDIETQLPEGGMRAEAVRHGCRSTICLPLLVDGSVVALMVLFAAGTGFFDEDELALLSEVAADVSFALQSIAQQEKVEYLSYYDTLTGLPNRTLFLDRARQQMRARNGEPLMVALVLLNLERFRNINETFGRHGGDELLRVVARRLEQTFQGKDYLARLGADGFGVVVRGVRDIPALVHVVENQILGCFREPFGLQGTELRVAARGGIAIYPVDGEDADTLFKNAEAALKKARESGEQHLFYAAEMNARAAHALSLETRLRKAVQDQQFVLHYQPKIDLATDEICGLEALIRWNDPETGLVPPMQFIPLLEETGMILEVGRWAIRRALSQRGEWRGQGLVPPRIAVNVSALQLQQRDFSDMVIAAVREDGGADALEVEVTESLLMKDVQASITKLSAVRERGVPVAMDDFGTGYSSLSYIARLPINSVKIDRSFIMGMAGGPHDMAIVTTIIALAHCLNLKVTAEGVETGEQSRLLKLLRCDAAQGYLFSKPLPAADIARLLAVEAQEIREPSSAPGPAGPRH